MAFRFRLDEPIQKEFRRIGLEQIDRARRELSARADAATEIHEARKCMKRIRALLRLGRVGLGDAVFRVENARFRAIAAGLAPARDGHVLLQTIVKLEAEGTQSEVQSALVDLKAAVLAQHAEPAAAEQDVTTAVVELDRAARRFKRLRMEPDDFPTLALGLKRSYRRGLEWLHAAYAENTDEGYHEWRKTVQAHWRHMQLLSRMWPALIDARIAAARELSQILGDDHDLALLRHSLDTPRSAALGRPALTEIERLIGARQTALRALARPRGQMIFAERAKAHGRRIVATWNAAVAKSREDAGSEETGAAGTLTLAMPAQTRA